MANLRAELNQFFKTKALRTWLGYVKPCEKKNAIRVIVPSSVFDHNVNAVSILIYVTFIRIVNAILTSFLLQYFKENLTFFVHDREKKAKNGDCVLIKELEEKKTILITHELVKVVYPRGDITDPITGRKVMNVANNDVRFRYGWVELKVVNLKATKFRKTNVNLTNTLLS